MYAVSIILFIFINQTKMLCKLTKFYFSVFLLNVYVIKWKLDNQYYYYDEYIVKLSLFINVTNVCFYKNDVIKYKMRVWNEWRRLILYNGFFFYKTVSVHAMKITKLY